MRDFFIPLTLAVSPALALFSSNLACEANDTISNDQFRYLGRVDPATRRLTWPATGMSFTFQGTSADVPIVSSTGTNAMAITVDGITTGIDHVNGTKISTGELTPGIHTVEIRKRSEAMFGTFSLGDPVTTGKFLPATQPGKRIEIIGDSISVGFGILGTSPCNNSAALEDATLTYGALTAKNLSADYSIVAWSGKGIVRNYVTAADDGDDGQPRIPELWTRYDALGPNNTYDFRNSVDIVVLNIGTNDFGYTARRANGTSFQARPSLNMTEYTDALVEFGGQIQAKYASAELFITTSPLVSDGYPLETSMRKTEQRAAVKSAVYRLGDKAHFVDFPAQDSRNNTPGCSSHPSRLTHERDAVILTDAIQAVVG